MLSKTQEATFLHTAITKINGTAVKIVFDNGCDATMATQSCVRKLNLNPIFHNRSLKINTMNGESEITAKTVKINFNEHLSVNAFVLNSNISLEAPKVDLSELWPELDPKISKQVKRNLASGNVDLIVGINEIYGKFSNTRRIQHPKRKLILLHTCFGFSIGGSSGKIDETNQNNDMVSLMSSIETEFDCEEPTLQLSHDDPNHVHERKIQENMEKIFSTEMNIAEDARENKSKDEVYAEQHFLKHLKFENGRYWTKPIFKSTFVPMLNNYNLCIRRYKNLRRQLSKNPELEEAYKRDIGSKKNAKLFPSSLCD